MTTEEKKELQSLEVYESETKALIDTYKHDSFMVYGYIKRLEEIQLKKLNIYGGRDK
jgi:hypothetical protein